MQAIRILFWLLVAQCENAKSRILSSGGRTKRDRHERQLVTDSRTAICPCSRTLIPDEGICQKRFRNWRNRGHDVVHVSDVVLQRKVDSSMSRDDALRCINVWLASVHVQRTAVRTLAEGRL